MDTLPTIIVRLRESTRSPNEVEQPDVIHRLAQQLHESLGRLQRTFGITRSPQRSAVTVDQLEQQFAKERYVELSLLNGYPGDTSAALVRQLRDIVDPSLLVKKPMTAEEIERLEKQQEQDAQEYII